ncbi:thrombospondin type-1 domain-containing protein 4-like [Liolophura sinensis]|uniref:thrombospondin type-1 domain-containing protein 4-like n=1 Tax=Liolophura sinensis TaxID=3198878 RepID=UPI0031597C0F
MSENVGTTLLMDMVVTDVPKDVDFPQMMLSKAKDFICEFVIPEIATEYRWSAWTEYSTCTRSCGIGIKFRQRACFRFGAKPELVDVSHCGGVSREAKTCNTQSCPRGARDFRSLQCSFFNGKKHGSTDHHVWVPYRSATPTFSLVSFAGAKFRRNTKIKSCALACTPHGRGHFVVQFSSHVVDGTECRENPHSVCVAGQCMAVGCDNELQSRARVDWCGVCGGDNSSCETLSGNIAKNLTVGYGELLTIPRGARHIKIVERHSRDVVLALRNTQGIFFINGHLETRYSTITRLVAGTVFYYHHPLFDARGMETFQAEGPISQELVVMGHTQQALSPVDILFEYTVLKNQSGRLEYDTYKNIREKSLPWEAILYEKLHPGYNIGAVGSAYVKRKKEGDESSFSFRVPPWEPPKPRLVSSPRLPEHEFVHQSTPRPAKPQLPPIQPQFQAPPTSSPSRAVPKKSSWLQTDRRSRLSSPSTREPHDTQRTTYARRISHRDKKLEDAFEDDRQRGVQFEFFECHRTVDGLTVLDSYCDERDKPDPRYHQCTRQQCVARWVTGIWSHCSRSCGDGQTFRSVRCWRMLAPGFDSTVHADQCKSYQKPESTSKCNEGACGPQWQFSSWGKCSAECGRGHQRRIVRCNTGDTRDCQKSPRPADRRTCGSATCDNFWKTTKWSRCSGPCGSGVRQRQVLCRGARGRALDERSCDRSTKPLSVQACGEKDYCQFVWVPQRWEKCTAECGEGTADRKVVCGAVSNGRFQVHPDSYCHRTSKPMTTARCREMPCEAKWLTTEWSKCSKSCGKGGIKMREVRCYHDDEESNGCDNNRKPKAVEECPLPACPEDRRGGPPCADDKKRINCDLVLKVQLCQHWYYKTACCRSCIEANRRQSERSGDIG